MSTRSSIRRIIGIGLCILPTYSAFAQDETTANIGQWIHFLVSFLSWAWIGLAALAGKLMTNELVFGGSFGMDVYLFKLRMITRNLANYGLGTWFIIMIAETLRNNSVNIASIIKKIFAFLFAGILINISFRITQALVDLSTIGTAAMGGISELFVQGNNSTKNEFIETTAQGTTITRQQNGTTNIQPKESTQTPQEILDAILPKNKSLAGPFLYLGSNILNIQQYVLLYGDNGNIENTGLAGYLAGKQKIVLGGIIQLLIVISFSMALLLLVVINIVRIIAIRSLAALGPLFFLVWGLKAGGVSMPSRIDSTIGNSKYSIGEFTKLIFTPVITTLVLSLVLIMSTTLYSTLNKVSTISINGDTNINTQSDTIAINDVIQTTYTGDLLGNTLNTTNGHNAFSDLIVAAVVIFLMWMMVKLSIPAKTPFIGAATAKAFKLAETAMLSTKMIPIPGVGMVSGGIINNAFSRRGNLNPIAMGNAAVRKLDQKSRQDATNFVNKITGGTSQTIHQKDLSHMRTQLHTISDNKKKVDGLFSAIKKEALSITSPEVIINGRDLFTDEHMQKMQPAFKAARGKGGVIGDDNKVFYNKFVIDNIISTMRKQGLTTNNANNIRTLEDLQSATFIMKKRT